MDNHKSCHCCQSVQLSVSQSLAEMDFERGIWSAAINGDAERVQKLLSNGVNVNSLDTSHYTALVSTCIVTVLSLKCLDQYQLSFISDMKAGFLFM
jgi:hypothetical protein